MAVVGQEMNWATFLAPTTAVGRVWFSAFKNNEDKSAENGVTLSYEQSTESRSNGLFGT